MHFKNNLKNTKAILIICFLIISITSLSINMSYAQEKVIVEIKAVGFEKDFKDVAKALLIAELEKNNAQVVTSSYNYKYSLNLMKLDQKIVVTIKKIDANGKIVYSEKAKAGSIDELDVIINRLVKSCVNKQNFESTADVRTVTDEESRDFKRKKVKQNLELDFQ